MFSNIKIFFKNIINDNSLNDLNDEYDASYETSYRSRIEFDENQEVLLNLLQKDLINSKYSIKSEESNYKSDESNYKSDESNYKSEESNYKLEESDYKSEESDYKSVVNFNMISYAYSDNSNSNKSNYDSNSSEHSINSDEINNFIENESYLYDNNEIDYSQNISNNIFKKLYKKIKSKISNKKSKKIGHNDNEIKPSYDISELVIYNNTYN